MTNLIEEKDVTAVNLSVELERAVISHELEEDSGIYVFEDGFFPFWIRVMDKRGFVGLSTHTRFKKSASQLQRLEFCNRINYEYFMVTAYVTDDERLKIDHVISFRDGMLKETFIRACRQFSRTIEKAMQALDPNHVLALAPGDTEEEDAGNE
jgi:hypothetical protein